jgi:hypothetical protein
MADERERVELDELLSIPHEDYAEIIYTLDAPEVELQPEVNILERLKAIPADRVIELSSKLRLQSWDPRADCWSDHYAQKDPNGWSDKFRNQCGVEVSFDRIPGRALDRPGPGFERPRF